VLFLSERTDAGAASLADVAPTVFAALGVAGPPMEGRDLMARGDARPPEGNGDWARGDARPSREAEAPYTAEEEKLIEARLRALGYYE